MSRGALRALSTAAGGAFRGLSAVVQVTIAMFFVVLVISLTVQVFSRYVLNSPTVWSEELALGAFVWMSMFALPLAIERDEHVKVDLFARRFPRGVLAGLLAFGWLMGIIVFAAMTWFGWTLLPAANRQVLTGMRTLTGWPVPLSTIYAALPLGGILSIVFITESFQRTLRLLFKPGAARQDVLPEPDLEA